MPRYVLSDDDRNGLRLFMRFQYVRTDAAARRSVEMFAGMEGAIGAPPFLNFAAGDMYPACRRDRLVACCRVTRPDRGLRSRLAAGH
jgi:hypothetical protein